MADHGDDMRQGLRRVGLAVLAGTLAGCAVDGGWMGAGDEAEYEQAHAAGQLAAPRDNRFYVEVHGDDRIQVFADAAEYERFRWTGRIERAVTAIGAGTQGQTVQYALNPVEAREQERRVGYQGAAQQMYDGRLGGHADRFYGEIHRDGRIYVFSDWAALQAFRHDGRVTATETFAALGPEQQTVIVAGPPEATLARFRAVHRLR